jgi:hypothetical protein
MSEPKSVLSTDDSAIDLSCKEAARLMSQARDRTLDAREQQSLKEHLDACNNCVRFNNQLDFLSALAKRYAAGKTEP